VWGNVKEKVRLLLGDYPDWYRLKVMKKESDRIFLLPTVLCVKQFIEAAQLIICVYPIPHCAKPVVEAGMFSKVAIVANNPEGLEYVKDGVTGFVVPHENPELLARKMDAVLNGSIDVEKLGRNAKAFVEKEFSKQAGMRVIMRCISGDDFRDN